MKNYILDGKTRDEIVKFLQTQVVPAPTGSGLMQVCQILGSLKEVEEPKTDDTNKEPKV
jgi:hypothetical protein